MASTEAIIALQNMKRVENLKKKLIHQSRFFRRKPKKISKTKKATKK